MLNSAAFSLGVWSLALDLGMWNNFREDSWNHEDWRGHLARQQLKTSPSLTPMGSQKETGSSVYVCVWLHLPNRHTAELLHVLQLRKAFTTQRAP